MYLSLISGAVVFSALLDFVLCNCVALVSFWLCACCCSSVLRLLLVVFLSLHGLLEVLLVCSVKLAIVFISSPTLWYKEDVLWLTFTIKCPCVCELEVIMWGYISRL